MERGVTRRSAAWRIWALSRDQPRETAAAAAAPAEILQVAKALSEHTVLGRRRGRRDGLQLKETRLDVVQAPEHGDEARVNTAPVTRSLSSRVRRRSFAVFNAKRDIDVMLTNERSLYVLWLERHPMARSSYYAPGTIVHPVINDIFHMRSLRSD
jgi:hypothetical protein